MPAGLARCLWHTCSGAGFIGADYPAPDFAGLRLSTVHMQRLLLLVAAAATICTAVDGHQTAVSPVMGEGGDKWNSVTIDCGAQPIAILEATYALPCQDVPACTAKCAAVPVGNLNADAAAFCNGKQKCVVSSCPCTAGNVPPAGAKCDEKWSDPAKSCQKGLTVTYRCGAASWGIAFLGALALVGGSYIGIGVAIGVKTTGASPALAVHPHFRQWDALRSLVMDGVWLFRGSGAAPLSRNQQRAASDKLLVPPPSSSGRSSPSKKSSKDNRHKTDGKDGKRNNKDNKVNKVKDGQVTKVATQITATEPCRAAHTEHPATREWAPTRTGLLSSGARETGVKVDL
eukprot:COSAG05_NODE_2280_length_3290_cov_13.660608_3_plen_344_part_00